MECAGIDVSKDELVTGFYPSEITFKMPNNDKGCAVVADILAIVEPPVTIVEWTGGYQQPIVDALYNAGVPVAVVNPRLTAKFAEGVNQPAKTDELDAVMLARFGSHVSVPLYHPPSDELVRLQSLVMRLEDLKGIRSRERNRLRRVKGDRAESVRKVLALLDQEIAEIKDRVSLAIAANEEWSRRKEILCSVPGVGHVTANALIALLPELGQYNKKAIARLAGLAPFTRESGKFKGSAKISGGRHPVRGALYMAALSATKCNPTIKRYYQRLVKSGKPKKVALIACARKLITVLNVLVAEGRFWHRT